MAGIDPNILYTDKLISISPEAVTFNGYYFFGCGKTVPISEIKKIEALKPSLLTGKYRYWGTSDPRGWMPMDWNRSSRGRIFLLHYKNKKFQIAFTAEDSFKVEDVLKQLGLMG